MSGSGLTCPSCGSSNVVEDDLYCQVQTVCVDCGSVVSEGALANDPAPVGGSDVSYRQTTAVAKKPCMNLKKGRQRLTAMCRILRVSKEIEELSYTYYNLAYQHQSFIKVTLEKKEVLAGCCVLVSCRLLNWPITIGTISCLLDTDPAVVGMIFQEMVKALSIKAPLVNVTEVIEAHSQEYKISSTHVPEELAENSKDLTKRAVALVELAADAWIVTGRKPVPIMMAAIYLAWQSLKPNKQRLKLTLEKFCQVAQVKKHPAAMTRISEIKRVLCKLGKEIPWLRELQSYDNILLHVEDILKHRYALLRRAMRNHEDTLLKETSCEESLASEISEPGQRTPNTPSTGQSEPNAEPEAETARQPGGDDPCAAPDLSGDTQESRDSAANWGKRVLFAPPCVTHSKKRRVEQPELKDVTGDEDISDSEIDSYIRTPREARDFALAQDIMGLLESEKS